MVIPPTLITTALSAVSKLIPAQAGGQGSNTANPTPNQSPEFKDAMRLVNLAKAVGDKLSAADKQRIMNMLQAGQIGQALATLQNIAAQMFSQGMAAASQATPPMTATASNGGTAAVQGTASTTPAPATASDPVSMMAARGIPRLGRLGYSTQGNLGQAFSNGVEYTLPDPGAATPTAATPSGSTVLGPLTGAATPLKNALAAVLGAGKTSPAAIDPGAAVPTTTAVNPTEVASGIAMSSTPDLPVSGISAQTSPLTQAAMAPNLAAAVPTSTAGDGTETPDANPTVAAVTGAAGADAATAAMQVDSAGAHGAQARDQENFFFMNALRKDMKEKPADGPDAADGSNFSHHLPPALTYEAPKISGATLDATLPQTIDRQKLIDQIMDGVFKPPVQLPKVVTLDLSPAHLGPLQVQVSMHDDGVRVQMMTAHPQVKAALEGSVADLSKALQSQGLALGHMGVDVRQDNNSQQQRFAQQQFGNPSESGRGHAPRFDRGASDNPIDGVAALPTAGAGPPAVNRWMLGALNAFA